LRYPLDKISGNVKGYALYLLHVLKHYPPDVLVAVGQSRNNIGGCIEKIDVLNRSFCTCSYTFTMESVLTKGGFLYFGITLYVPVRSA
jgi:hypothetical protein